MKKNTKRVFYDRHERENVIEYQETFFNKMKSFLLYFVEFYEDGIIVSKEFPDDYAVESPNQRPIIMITYDESTFSAKDGRKKV